MTTIQELKDAYAELSLNYFKLINSHKDRSKTIMQYDIQACENREQIKTQDATIKQLQGQLVSLKDIPKISSLEATIKELQMQVDMQISARLSKEEPHREELKERTETVET